jgi:hypothetical protein
MTNESPKTPLVGDDPLHLTIQAHRLERFGRGAHDEGEIHYTYYSDGTLLGKSIVDVATKRTLLSRLIELTERDESAQWDKERHARLASIGQQLFTLIVPEQVRKTVFDSEDSLDISLEVQDHDIPWELLHDGQEFLAERHAIGRRVIGPARPPQPDRRAVRVVVVGDPTSDLSGARLESAAVTERCRTVLADLGSAYAIPSEVILLQGKDASKETVLLDLLMDRDETIDIFHFAGHAYANRRDPDDAGLTLADGNLRAFEARSMGSSPLVFVNGCHAGQPHDSSITFGAVSGLAAQFAAGGALGYIAPTWPVNDRVAQELASAFYGFLIGGESIGRALLGAKRAVEDPDALAYVFYGEVDERLPIFTPQMTSGPYVNDYGVHRIVSTEREFDALELLAVNDLPWVLWDSTDILGWTSRIPIDRLRQGAATQALLEYVQEFGSRIKDGRKRLLCIMNAKTLPQYVARRGRGRWDSLVEELDDYLTLPNFTLILALPESTEIEEIELVSRSEEIPPSPSESVYVFNKQTRFEQSHLTYNLFEDYNPRMISRYWAQFEELIESSLRHYADVDIPSEYSETFSAAVNRETRQMLNAVGERALEAR